jgi:hypothetical protein
MPYESVFVVIQKAKQNLSIGKTSGRKGVVTCKRLPKSRRPMSLIFKTEKGEEGRSGVRKKRARIGRNIKGAGIVSLRP